MQCLIRSCIIPINNAQSFSIFSCHTNFCAIANKHVPHTRTKHNSTTIIIYVFLTFFGKHSRDPKEEGACEMVGCMYVLSIAHLPLLLGACCCQTFTMKIIDYDNYNCAFQVCMCITILCMRSYDKPYHRSASVHNERASTLVLSSLGHIGGAHRLEHQAA